MRAELVLAGVLCLSACGPVPLARAERECFERARLAAQPRGEVAVGATTNGGPYVGGELTITSDYLRGRDPSDLYNSCVMQMSGQMPSRPLYDRPDWKG